MMFVNVLNRSLFHAQGVLVSVVLTQTTNMEHIETAKIKFLSKAKCYQIT